ncbi:MAG: SGNH/GDSL hydrolase family protein [Alphaproteobacteria bacterium]|nr:SGNH/GDSL hydrolase family protein [Alphaproteobacteria bacterium]
MSGPPRPVRRLASWALGVALFLGTAEVGLRLVDRLGRDPEAARLVSVDGATGLAWGADGGSPLHVASDLPGVVYGLRPSADVFVPGFHRRFVTNALGFRDRERTHTPPAGVRRVLVLGDSVTFGWQVDGDQTFTARAEALLRTPDGAPCPVEILNLGVGGYDTEQEAAVLSAWGPRLSPDLVVVAYVFNDHGRGADAGLWDHFTRSRSRLWDALRKARLRLEAAGTTPDPVTRGLERIAAWLDAAQVPGLVVAFPPFPVSAEGGPPPQGLVEAARVGLGTLDLAPAYRAAGPGPWSADGLHPDAAGHEVAARAVAEAVVEVLGVECGVEEARP